MQKEDLFQLMRELQTAQHVYKFYKKGLEEVKNAGWEQPTFDEYCENMYAQAAIDVENLENAESN